MNVLQTDRLASAVRKIFGIKQSSSPLPTLAVELQAVFDLGRHELASSARSLGWDLVHGNGFVAASALNVPMIGIVNPVASGKIAVVENVHSTGVGAFQIQMFMSVPAGFFLNPAGQGNMFLDSRRVFGAGVPTVHCGARSNVGIVVIGPPGGGFVTIPLAPVLPLGVTLLPGSQLVLVNNILNTSLALAFSFRFRDLIPGEEAV